MAQQTTSGVRPIPERVALRLLGVRTNGSSCLTVTFGASGALGSTYQPGAITLISRDDVEPSHVALASDASVWPRVELLVRKDSNLGRDLQHHPQSAWWMGAPFGAPFPVEHCSDRDVLLVAQGSGIAPLRQAINARIALGTRRRTALLHGVRDARDAAFTGEHAGWRREGVAVALCTTAGPAGVDALGGRVQVHLPWLLGGLRAPSVWVCGSTEMMDQVARACEQLGVDSVDLHRNF